MRVLVLGAGLVGTELARRLRDQGKTVVGTTTTEAKVPALKESCDEVHVLRGSDVAAVARAAEGVDADLWRPDAQLVVLSSLSVYGDAANDLDEVDEDAPLTTSPDASPRTFQAMERTYLDGRCAVGHARHARTGPQRATRLDRGDGVGGPDAIGRVHDSVH